jgi:hypothetical protein
MEKVNPVVHGMAMYEVFLKHDKMTHDLAPPAGSRSSSWPAPNGLDSPRSWAC